jgi:hypothetical protein
MTRMSRNTIAVAVGAFILVMIATYCYYRTDLPFRVDQIGLGRGVTVIQLEDCYTLTKCVASPPELEVEWKTCRGITRTGKYRPTCPYDGTPKTVIISRDARGKDPIKVLAFAQ